MPTLKQLRARSLRRMRAYRRARAAYLKAKRRLRRRPLRLKALAEARKFIGVMEQGGNNRGPEVDKIIKANGGVPGEPWCGDGLAYVYRLAGSKAVTREWAVVRWYGRIAGVRQIKEPEPGDIVRFRFDHVGMVETIHPAAIQTIEFNTGATGAVSDSRKGGDGVYRKVRTPGQIRDYFRVSR